MDATSQATWRVYSAAHGLRTGGRDAVRDALLAARARTLALADAYAAALGPRGFRVPYRTTINPPLWEWGHVAWFQEWWVARNAQRSRGIACDPDHARAPSRMPEADAMYDSSRVAHTRRWELALPDEKTTREWLAATLGETLSLLDALPDAAGHDELYFFRLVTLHEEMHAEAAIYMAESLAIPVPASVLRDAPPLAGSGAMLKIPAQRWQAGWSEKGFAFDNELQPVRVDLDAFEIDAEPVSQARFQEFVEAGGYRTRRYWDDDGWAWLKAHEGLARERKLPHPTGQAAATHLTAYEAQAWCRWAGRRLPTEFEWECTALTHPGFSWGQAWEWTSSRFTAYPGFVPHPYREYSAPWFDTRRVLRGACPATSAALAHPRYRNFFEPQRSDIFAGFRSCA
jgi:ergothioneine biosynthesis protein EgtB